jgi:curved DNA-binding protein CbpA
MSEGNFYKILGVPSYATGKEIKQAYLRLTQKYRSDANRGLEQWANDRLMEVNEAYETLVDPEKRKQYDNLRITQRSKDIRTTQKSHSIQRKKLRKKTSLTPTKTDIDETKQRKSKNTAIITASAILAVIIAVVVTSWYLIYKAPLQRNIIEFNDQTVKIEYLLKRCLMNTSDPNNVQGTIQTIIYELLYNDLAPQYGINVTEADIDQYLRDMANLSTTNNDTGGNQITLSDAEFKEWYRQNINQSTLSERQYRNLIKSYVISQRIQALIEANMPTTTEQVHLYDIYLSDYDQAVEWKQKMDEGEDFMTIASEISLDTDTKDKGGDMGWIPITVLSANLKSAVTDLEIGVVSDPIPVSTDSTDSTSQDQGTYYVLLMITEKAVAMEVDANYIDAYKSILWEEWITNQVSTQNIKLIGKGASGGYDSETEAWLQYQIEKLKKSRGIEETTTTTASSLTG